MRVPYTVYIDNIGSRDVILKLGFYSTYCSVTPLSMIILQGFSRLASRIHAEVLQFQHEIHMSKSSSMPTFRLLYCSLLQGTIQNWGNTRPYIRSLSSFSDCVYKALYFPSFVLMS